MKGLTGAYQTILVAFGSKTKSPTEDTYEELQQHYRDELINCCVEAAMEYAALLREAGVAEYAVSFVNEHGSNSIIRVHLQLHYGNGAGYALYELSDGAGNQRAVVRVGFGDNTDDCIPEIFVREIIPIYQLGRYGLVLNSKTANAIIHGETLKALRVISDRDLKPVGAGNVVQLKSNLKQPD